MATAMVCTPVENEAFAQTVAWQQQQEIDDAALARSLAAGGGVDHGLSRTFEQTPSTFHPRDQGMLYIACEIGESEIEILVDTGAEMSVVSEPLARELGLLSRLDRAHRGVASGVGQAQILGRLWDIPVKLGHVEFELNFSVLSSPQPLLILGLDQMRRFQCLVDLPKSCLVFGGRDGVEVPFSAAARGLGSMPIDSVLAQGRRAVGRLQARDPIGARAVLSTLSRVLTNILSSPSDPKYRCLRGRNERLQREVLAHPEAIELLRLAGFVAETENLVLPAHASLHALRLLAAPGGILA